MKGARAGRTVAAAAAFLCLAACGHITAPGSSPSPSAGTVPSVIGLKYGLITRFGPPAFCDPDFYPVAREVTDSEIQQRLASIQRSEPETYRGILAHHGWAGALSPQQARQAYQDYKALRAITLTAAGAGYSFTYVAGAAGGSATQATRYQGRIDSAGGIVVEAQSPTAIRCPICLAQGVLISTPGGPVPVQSLKAGMLVYSADAAGRRLIEPVQVVSSTEAPPWHEVEVIDLADGRVLVASPGHPTADGRRLGQLEAGDLLDGARVVRVALIPYGSGWTYDLLPAGPTGEYWADGVLVGSTLRRPYA